MSNLVGAQMRQNLSGSAAAIPRPMSEIDSEMELLERALHEASNIVGDLLDRITPVLIPESLGNACGVSGAAQDPLLSPLADQVRSQRRRVEALSERARLASVRLAI